MLRVASAGSWRLSSQRATEVGDPDIVVNNAGVVSGALLLDVADDQIQRTFEVNTLALYWVTKAVEADRRLLVMPPLVRFVPLLRILPPSQFDRVMDLLGVNTSMERFVGRDRNR